MEDFMELKKQKKCTKCGQIKPVSEFSKNNQSKDGLAWWCKPCHRSGARTAYYKRKSKITKRPKSVIASRQSGLSGLELQVYEIFKNGATTFTKVSNEIAGVDNDKHVANVVSSLVVSGHLVRTADKYVAAVTSQGPAIKECFGKIRTALDELEKRMNN
jgi:hypothetical protein